MPVHINSAYRVREILKRLSKHDPKERMVDVWAALFSIDEVDSAKRSFSISRCLADLHDEVELVRTQMQDLDFSPALFSESLQRCNTAFSATHLNHRWDNISSNVAPEVITVLGFCSEILPDEEVLLESKEIQELESILSDLKKASESSSLPAGLKRTIEKHRDKMQEAIMTYSISGAKVFEDVIQSALGEVVVNQTLSESLYESKEAQKLSELWKKAKVLLDKSSYANKSMNSLVQLGEKGQKLIEIIQNISN